MSVEDFSSFLSLSSKMPNAWELELDDYLPVRLGDDWLGVCLVVQEERFYFARINVTVYPMYLAISPPNSSYDLCLHYRGGILEHTVMRKGRSDTPCPVELQNVLLVFAK